MPVTCVFGAQWGDEGKGKIVDFLAADSDFAVRFQGGANAGHTIKIGDDTYALRLTPSGVLQGAVGVIGNGVALDAGVLRHEIELLKDHAVDLRVSDRAQLVLPYHRALDKAMDASRSDRWRNNTTGRGVSVCMADKHSYEGFRVADLLSDAVRRNRLVYLLERGNARLRALGAKEIDIAAATTEAESWVELLRPLACDVGKLLRDAHAAGKQILLEGAQAALLDVDFGTYPFVSSSHCGANGIASGTGLPPRSVNRIIAVAKAYATRVGSDAGPFPTRDEGPDGVHMQEQGREFGTVTGRPRRCGWFDAVAMRHVCAINGVDRLALTKIDVLAGIDPLRICVAYEVDGKRIDEFPADVDVLTRCQPVYRDVEGFTEALDAVREPDELPASARAYVAALEAEVGTPIELLSVGPDRTETLRLQVQ